MTSGSIEPGYTKTDHICRVCFGRVMRVDGKSKRKRLWSCANCGFEIENRLVKALCVCGAKYSNGRDRGLRCVRNENHQPGVNAEIIVMTVEEIEKQSTERAD